MASGGSFRASLVDLLGRLRATKGRVLGLDVGSQFVGVAVSDALNQSAHPVTTLMRVRHKYRGDIKYTLPTHMRGRGANEDRLRVDPRPIPVPLVQTVGAINHLVNTHQACGICVGLPVTLTGHAESQAHKTLHFVRKLRDAGVTTPFFMWDERMSTWSAKAHLSAVTPVGTVHGKLEVDSTAAAVILQSFLRELNTVRN